MSLWKPVIPTAMVCCSLTMEFQAIFMPSHSRFWSAACSKLNNRRFCFVMFLFERIRINKILLPLFPVFQPLTFYECCALFILWLCLLSVRLFVDSSLCLFCEAHPRTCTHTHTGKSMHTQKHTHTHQHQYHTSPPHTHTHAEITHDWTILIMIMILFNNKKYRALNLLKKW